MLYRLVNAIKGNQMFHSAIIEHNGYLELNLSLRNYNHIFSRLLRLTPATTSRITGLEILPTRDYFYVC